jgi:hypothetical protein
MGVILSHYDTWLHSHFFPEPWQVALVVEPFSSVAGFFIRQADGALDPTRYFGFHEMDGADGHSIVRWHNLQRVEAPPQPAEAKPKVEIKPRDESPVEPKSQPREGRPRVELKSREDKVQNETKGGKTP